MLTLLRPVIVCATARSTLRLPSSPAFHKTLLCSFHCSNSKMPLQNKQGDIGFISGAAKYDQHRPSYTAEVVSITAAEVTSTGQKLKSSNIATKYDVLELGAGTGKLTELLVRELPSSVRYLATELSQDFLATLEAKSLNVQTMEARAENMPQIPDGSVENVVCAQSFHWFSHPEGLKEIRRVLAPGGSLIVVFNLKNFDEGWMKLFADQRKQLVQRFGGSDRHWVNSMEWSQDIDVSTSFSLKEHRSLKGIEFSGSVDAIVETFSTASAYQLVPKEEAKELIEQLKSGIKNWPGIDETNITVPFSTEYYVYTATS